MPSYPITQHRRDYERIRAFGNDNKNPPVNMHRRHRPNHPARPRPGRPGPSPHVWPGRRSLGFTNPMRCWYRMRTGGPVWWNGRHKGLKIPWPAMAVWVRIPPPAPLRASEQQQPNRQARPEPPCPTRAGLREASRMSGSHSCQVLPAQAAKLFEPAPDDVWLCWWCLNRITSEADRLVMGGASQFTFLNPEGRRFHILTFNRAPGCKQRGTPTFKHTWFPGYAWVYSICARCGMQLGWKYMGNTEFFGLIRNRIVRASQTWS